MFTFNRVEFSGNGKVGRAKSDVAIIGCPFDLGSTRSAGQREAPPYIRFIDMFDESARSLIYGMDPFEVLSIVDCGDVQFSDGDTDGGWQAIRDKVRQVYGNVKVGVIMLGGDHSITPQAMAAIAEKEGPLTVIHLDAHTDTWKPDPGMPYNHGTWVRYALDSGFANRVVQLGVRGWGSPESDIRWGEKNDVTMYHANTPNMRGKLQEELEDTSDAIYLSVDLDVCDPAFAPGVVFQEPGGMTSRELLGLIQQVMSSGKVVAADVTELVPSKDPSQITTKLANRCVYQMLTGFAAAAQS